MNKDGQSVPAGYVVGFTFPTSGVWHIVRVYGWTLCGRQIRQSKRATPYTMSFENRPPKGKTLCANCRNELVKIRERSQSQTEP